MRLPMALIYLMSAAPLAAHSDPRGEKHPLVVVDAKENFRVFYDYSDADYQSRMSLLLAEDGKELIPRHRLSPSALQAFGIPTVGDSIFFDMRPDPLTDAPEVVLAPVAGDKYQLALTLRSKAADRQKKPATPEFLPFEPLQENIEEYLVTQDYAAVISTPFTSETSPSDIMMLRCCRKTGGQSGTELKISNVSSIFSPTVSPLVWANGRFWIAWVRQRGRDDKATWTTVLTGLDPVTGKAEHHDLQGLSHWNTTVALAANANGVLCAAWAASIDGSYPGRARLVTAVFPTKP
jgi:hypothetical protein